MSPAWSITPFAPAHQPGIIALISGIQRAEFGLAITPEDQPDLMDIEGFYLSGTKGPGMFWTALDETGGVCGSIALLNIGADAEGQGQGALRKMFVRADCRGTGLAQALLAALLFWCPGAGIGRLYLGTTERFLAAHRFYEKQGFARIDKTALPQSFPVMAVDSVFYARTVSPGI